MVPSPVFWRVFTKGKVHTHANWIIMRTPAFSTLSGNRLMLINGILFSWYSLEESIHKDMQSLLRGLLVLWLIHVDRRKEARSWRQSTNLPQGRGRREGEWSSWCEVWVGREGRGRLGWLSLSLIQMERGPHTQGSNLYLTQYSDLVISRVPAPVQYRQLSLTVDGRDDVVVDKWWLARYRGWLRHYTECAITNHVCSVAKTVWECLRWVWEGWWWVVGW